MVLSFEKSLKKGKRQKELVEFCEKLEIAYPSENALTNSLFYTISIEKKVFFMIYYLWSRHSTRIGYYCNIHWLFILFGLIKSIQSFYHMILLV